MLRRSLAALIVFGILVSLQHPCFSEESANEEWDPSSAGLFTTWTAPLCGEKCLVVQPYLFYNRTLGTFDADGNYSDLTGGDKQSQFLELLFLQYGLSGRLELDAQMLYHQTRVTRTGLEADASGLGDSFLFLRYSLTESDERLPRFTAVAHLKMPTGKYENADPAKLGADIVGSGSWDPGFGLIATKKLRPFVLHADATVSFPLQTTVDGVETRYAPYINYDFGAEYFLPKGFNLVLEANGLSQGDQTDDGVKTPGTRQSVLLLVPGIGWSTEKIQTLLGYAKVVSGFNVDAVDSVVFTCVLNF
jgi:hypothetical protein